jgi:hypothetical protein
MAWLVAAPLLLAVARQALHGCCQPVTLLPHLQPPAPHLQVPSLLLLLLLHNLHPQHPWQHCQSRPAA